MTLKIQVLTWNRHEHVADLNLTIGSGTAIQLIPLRRVSGLARAMEFNFSIICS
jgi:hypothetical protein